MRAASCRCRRRRRRSRASPARRRPHAWKRSLTSRNSRSRPTNGASSALARPSPPRFATTRSARQRWAALGLALELVLAAVLVGDGRLGSALRRLADEHGARLGRRLDARRRVDEVARDHALALGAERDRGLAREDAGARPQRSGRAPGTAATRSSAARTARSASSSCATGVPHTAITASPMNFSTVPP